MGVIQISYWYIWLIILIFCIIIPRRNKLYLEILKRKKKGRKRKMPQELIKEFIGKVCTIILFNESFGIQGKIVAIEDNWIKVEEKNKVRLINGDMIRDISIAPDKYQK
jgi:hypothetical protein